MGFGPRLVLFDMGFFYYFSKLQSLALSSAQQKEMAKLLTEY